MNSKAVKYSKIRSQISIPERGLMHGKIFEGTLKELNRRKDGIFAPDMLLTKKKKILKELREKYQTESSEEVYARVEQFLMNYAVVSYPGYDPYVYRLRHFDCCIVKDFWYPEPKKTPLNRLNLQGHPVLYCSSSIETCFSEFYDCMKDGDVVSICKWKISADPDNINIIPMGFNRKSIIYCDNERIEWDEHRRRILKEKGYDSQVNEFIDEFLFKIFTKPTNKCYKISAAVGKLYLDNSRGGSKDVVVYPSVKCKGKEPGVNWAFSPKFAKDNMVSVNFSKYKIKQDKAILIATAQYDGTTLLLDTHLEWHEKNNL